MDVSQSQYWKQLLAILNHIANAKYVAFDLEMSGIAVRTRYGPNATKGHDNGKPDLQALYDEVRAAAELYQVLQVGITCVEEDREKGFYLVRPFNFNMTPLLYQENKVKDRFPERKIVFSSSAADFLQNQAGFDIGKVFREGVYYLSMMDEDETRQRFRDRMARESTQQDSVVPPSNKEVLDFQRHVHRTISEWVNAEKPEYPFINVGDPKGGELNGFQRMLVHQLVRSEFPGYRSFPRGNNSFVQIEKLNEKKEAQFKARKLNDFNDAIAKQIGLRWIFEALAGGDFEGFKTNLLTDEYADDPELSQIAIDKKFDEVKDKLKNKKHVLVGHNLFTDLVCVYSTFIGPLPLKVEDFQSRIHALYPVVFDTKYIVTEGETSMSSVMRKNLEELVTPYTKIHTTRFMLHEEHTAYGSSLGKKHEAGFDSYMTAHLFAKLSAELFAKRSLTENFDVIGGDDNDEDEDYDDRNNEDDDDEDDEDERNEDDEETEDITYHTVHDNSSVSSQTASDSTLDGGAKLIQENADDDLLSLTDSAPDLNGFSYIAAEGPHTPLAETNGYYDGGMSDNLPAAWHVDQMQRLPLDDNNPFAVLAGVDGTDGNGAVAANLDDGQQWIPSMNSSFWQIYVNKLRVNASEGGICDLSMAFR